MRTRDPQEAWPEAVTTGPFSLSDDDAYRRWRDAKLAGYPHPPEACPCWWNRATCWRPLFTRN